MITVCPLIATVLPRTLTPHQRARTVANEMKWDESTPMIDVAVIADHLGYASDLFSLLPCS